MLRLGLLLDTEKVPLWVAEIVNRLNQLQYLKLVIIIYHKRRPSKAHLNSYNFLKKVEYLLWPTDNDYSSLTTLNFSQELPTLSLENAGKENQVFFSEDALNKIAEYSPDLLLYFGSKPISGKILELPGHGVWSLCFGESNVLHDTMPGFWEWYFKKPYLKISLIKFTGKPSQYELIYELKEQTIRLSFSKNQTLMFSKSIILITEEVTRLAMAIRKSASIISPATERVTGSFLDQPEKPECLHVLKATFRLVVRALKNSLKELIFDKGWVVFYDLSAAETPSLDFHKFNVLIPPGDCFWADPTVISHDDRHYIFIEEFLWTTKKGHITCLTLDAKGKILASKVILEKPYHLSYPFIFQYNSIWYMVPESTENKAIDLYECTGFPYEWTFRKTLISDIHAVDSTIYFHENRFWLFCAVQHRLSSSVYDDLYIFHSPDLMDQNWTPHPQNPVVSDIKTARPAGRIFYHNGALCRPSQIGEPDYGYGLSLNRITELNENRFKEERYISIIPDWRKELSSVHTLNFSNKMTVTDGVLRRVKFFY